MLTNTQTSGQPKSHTLTRAHEIGQITEGYSFILDTYIGQLRGHTLTITKTLELKL